MEWNWIEWSCYLRLHWIEVRHSDPFNVSEVRLDCRCEHNEEAIFFWTRSQSWEKKRAPIYKIKTDVVMNRSWICMRTPCSAGSIYACLMKQHTL
jgi:hypothetical protein